MSAVLRNSTLYAKRYVNKYLGDAREGFGRAIPLPFEVTVVSASTVGDTYNLTVIPANCRVVALQCTTDGLGGSAGFGATCAIGDSGAAARYMVAADFDVTNAQGALAPAGMGYTPTADTIVVATGAGAAWVVGKKIMGTLWVVPPAA